MKHKKLIISGVGCSLVDSLYNNISFKEDRFLKFLSKEKGDGGLIPGKLVFKDKFENFTKKLDQSYLHNIIFKSLPDKMTIGGPGIVPMIHAAQLSNKEYCEFHFYGVRGNDDNGNFIQSLLEKTPLFINNYKITKGETPTTVVLSDSNYNEGNGERIFINTIGSAREYSPNDLSENFFDSNILVFGGTALLPLIHDNLTELLKKGKLNNCITIVNTVYDFKSELESPDLNWPLGKNKDSYKHIDLLIMDHEEALRLSGQSNLDKAMLFFIEAGTGAVIVTNGIENVRIFSKGSLFETLDESEMPISKAVTQELKKENIGDTTGCGDNFVGGVIASLISQIQEKTYPINLKEACIWGIISGGTTCFYVGGMYEEKYFGEKKDKIAPYYSKYREQID